MVTLTAVFAGLVWSHGELLPSVPLQLRPFCVLILFSFRTDFCSASYDSIYSLSSSLVRCRSVLTSRFTLVRVFCARHHNLNMRLPSPLILLICSTVPVFAGPATELSLRAVSPDDTCGSTKSGNTNGYTCPSNKPCCSVNGWCGSTDAYCLTSNGCQASFGNCTAPLQGKTVSPDFTCGLTGGGTLGYTCPTSAPCCSGA